MRRFLVPLAAIAALVAGPVFAQAFPTKPVHLLVGFPAGGTGDRLARLVGDKLAEAWGQPVVVENRTGATGMVALGAVARSIPDGYTLGMFSSGHVLAAVLSPPPFSVATALTPIASVAEQSTLLVVNPAVSATTVAGLIEIAKAQPGRLTFASGGNGAPAHIAGEIFARRAGVSLVHVPYKGGQVALQDVVAGHVAFMFAPAQPALPLVKAGKLRALAIDGRSRHPGLPDVPTLRSAGFDIEVPDWHGIVGPAGMAPELVANIHQEIGRILALPDVRERILAMLIEPLELSSDAFASLVRQEVTRSQTLVQDAGLQSP